jgi:hypothetical protein
LGTPPAATLFLVGEATDAEGQTGTVHGVPASGNRMVGEILPSRENLWCRPVRANRLGLFPHLPERSVLHKRTNTTVTLN